MFEHIHFFKSDITLITKNNFSYEENSLSLSPIEKDARASAFDTLGVNAEFNVPGHTSILFPPLSSGFTSAHTIVPQGFFFCEHWKGYFTKRQNYHSYMLSYTLKGNGVLEYEGNTYDLKENNLFFIDCEEQQYYYTKDSIWEHVDVHFYGDYAKDLYQEFRAVGGPVSTCRKNSLLLQHFEELAEIWDNSQLYASQLISNKLEELLLNLLILMKKDKLPEKQVDTLSYVVKYIEKHFAEPLTLDFLADFSSTSKYHFSRIFKEYTGFSPIEYIISLRITHAKNMLIDSNLSVKQIAFSTGFTDINNFTKQFKKIEHMTPPHIEISFGRYNNKRLVLGYVPNQTFIVITYLPISQLCKHLKFVYPLVHQGNRKTLFYPLFLTNQLYSHWMLLCKLK